MEYRRKCTICGKIYCYTSDDLSNNNKNSVNATISAIGAIASLFGGTRLDTYALNSQADRYNSKIINFEQCPNCHSVSTVLLSDKEWEELQKQSALSGNVTVKTIEINANATVESLLKRACLFLEDAEWQSANSYFDKILDVEPENAQAYLGKLLAELQISTISKLQTCDKAFEKSSNWKKALRFADKKLSDELQQYALERSYRVGLYAKASAQSAADYKAVAEYFSHIAGFRDVNQLMEQCLDIAENESNYEQATALQEQDTEKTLEQAVIIYEAISPYKDSAQKAIACRKRILALQEELHQKEKLQEEKRIAKAATKKRNKIIFIFSSIAIMLIPVIIVISSQIKYKHAEDALALGDYDGAIAAFSALGNYSDASERSIEAQYAKIDDLLSAGNYYGAATALSKLWTYSNARKRFFELWGEINRTTIAAGAGYTVGLKSNGTVIATGRNEDGQCAVSKWSDIIAIAAGFSHTVGLKSNGTVIATGRNEDGQCAVSKWSDIIAVVAGVDHTVGLKSNGTVIATGRNEDGQCNVSSWTDIVATAAGFYHTVGLKSDGTVIAMGQNKDSQCNVSSWTDIVSVAAGTYHTVGLKSDGTVIATGANRDGQCNVSSWTNIVAIATGGLYTVGLKSDGTVIATGVNKDGQCNVSDWTDIVAVAVCGIHTVGLKSDGTVIATGQNENGQCNVSDWTDIKVLRK